MGMMLMLQQKTARTRILEFLREPFSGSWIGTPGFLTVAQIVDGADVPKSTAYTVLAALAKAGEVRVSAGRPVMFAALH